MKLEVKSFRTKVARRIFVLFIICAVLPISLFAAVSFFHVKKHIIDQQNEILRRESKALAVSFYERLIFLRSELQLIAAHYETNAVNPASGQFDIVKGLTGERFTGLSLLIEGKPDPADGENVEPPRMSSEERAHLESGEALLYRANTGGTFPELLMCIAMGTQSGNRKILAGTINPAYLLEGFVNKPPLTELYVTDRSGVTIFCTLPGVYPDSDVIDRSKFQSTSGHFNFLRHGNRHLVGYSTLFLRPNFHYPELVVALIKSRSDIMAPIIDFNLVFLLIIVFTFGLVFFFSINLIKQNMGPIEVLKNATKKISEGYFGHRVDIRSSDEFETLGQAFNEMSDRLKEGQELLVNAAKMNTMGQMAAGIMHEIRQPLTAVSGNLELALLERSAGGDIDKRLNIVLDAVSRLHAILNRFKSFSSRSKENMSLISINDIIFSIYELMEHQLIKQNITCKIEADENLPFVYGDKQHLQQVISNLIVNAIHALEERNREERRIVIKTSFSEENVYMAIEDNGCGIPKNLQERIFDPYFTTKSAEKGTGLGMAIIKSILHNHRAQINLDSEEGKGTVFTVVFPTGNIGEES